MFHIPFVVYLIVIPEMLLSPGFKKFDAYSMRLIINLLN